MVWSREGPHGQVGYPGLAAGSAPIAAGFPRMTKLRTPLTTGAALDRVAGRLPGGYAELAKRLERNESYVRALGDPDRREKICFDDAISADLVYREAGGAGAPFFETYGYQLDQAGVSRFADEIALARLVGDSVRESGEAHAAVIALAQPGADRSARASTIREVEEAIAANNSVLQLLRTAAAADKHGHEATAPPG